MSQDGGKARLTPQQREALERRSRLTQRRQELTTRIRKQKKTKYLQKKRGLPCTVTNGQDHSANGNGSIVRNEFRDLLDAYCQNPTTPEQLLPVIQNFVAKTSSMVSSEHPLILLNDIDENYGLKFLDCLRDQIIKAIKDHRDLSFQSILRILVHLTYLSSGDGIASSTAGSTDYYGRRPSTWSELLLSPLQDTSTNFQSASASPSWLEIFAQLLSSSKEVELASLILGNMFGDEGASRGVFQAMCSELKTAVVTGLIRSVSSDTPTAAWTLTNMIRNDNVSFASTYCSEMLLSASLLSAWLREPSLATQTAWIVNSLTEREEDILHYLAREQGPSFLSTMIQSIQNPSRTDQTLPLLQALGNFACHESFVRVLLSQTDPALAPLVQQILSSAPSRDPLLIQASWLARCLLVDTGIPNHPSTTIAAQAFIPSLLVRLGRNGMTLEEEREFASALWSALESPPVVNESNIQNGSLWPNQSFGPTSVQLPFEMDVPRSTLQTLIRLINSSDSDAKLAGVQVIGLLMRRESHSLSNLRIVLQEEDLPDALECVCLYPSEAADVAADILDDFFYNDEDSCENEGDKMMESTIGWPTTNTTTSTFGFGIGADAQTPSRTVGRGRGRGATMPAWMTK